MPVFLIVVRRALCMVCTSLFDLEPGSPPPDGCLICGSHDWEFGPESTESVLIRQGIARRRKPLNPGVTHRGRREHAKRLNEKKKQGEN
jgi:hypothetical protein